MLNLINTIILMCVGAYLFRKGGKGGFPYAKLYRRLLLPLSFVYMSAMYFHNLYSFIFLSYIGIFSIGYGDRLYKICKYDWLVWIARFGIGILFVAPCFWFGFSKLFIITPIIWTSIFFLSNWKPTEFIVSWEYVEIVTGGLIGLTVASVII